MRLLDRRGFLRVGAAATVAGLASACGGGGRSGATINYMGGTSDMEVLHKVPSFEDWLRRDGVVVRPQFIPDDTAALQKLAAGGPQGVNLVSWINQFRNGWRSLDLFAPLETARIPHYANVIQDFGGPSFAGTQRDAQGRVIAIPETWSVSGIVYDSAAMPAPTSYTDLLDPKYKGRVAMLDDPGATMIIGCLILGYDPPALTKAQFREVIDLMGRFVKACRALPQGSADLTTLMGSGEVIACPVDASFLPKMLDQGKKSFRVTIALKEGGFSYGTLMSTLKNADDTDAVHAFLDHFLTDDVAQAMAKRSPSVMAIKGATKYLPDWYTESVPVNDLPKLFHDNPSLDFPPAQATGPDRIGLSEFLTGWQQAKVGAR
ncbi:ABC transporter substrate-binding protein [Pseudonocardia acaciae]|uniref:ABC transporter substrate-binding protein n=1 Tax=Pseudonocardia acaciae TaxID=551276 RepID=UPI00048B85D3|nr:extracellular solute-binding protein [Pseudonocardia acaciae]